MSLSRSFRVILFFLAMLNGLSVSAQNNDPVINETIVTNAYYYLVVDSDFPPIVQDYPSQWAELNISPWAPGQYRLTYLPSADYEGTESFAIEYYETNFPIPIPTPHTISVNLNIVISIVDAHVDVVKKLPGQDTLEIFPLANDYTSAGYLDLNGISQVHYGNATETDSNTIIYTNPLFDETDYIIYSVIDSIGTTSSTEIYIVEEDLSAPLTENLFYTISNNSSKVITLPLSGFEVDSTDMPQLGEVISAGEMGFQYTPGRFQYGVDTFPLVKTGGYVYTVHVEVLNNPGDDGFVMDDSYVMPKNTSLNFNVFDNDLNSNYDIINYSTQLTYNGDGDFTYTPEMGFTGTRNFFYEVDFGVGTESGAIKIHVDNYEPQSLETYEFKTLKNKSVVLEYEVPIGGYYFNEVVGPPNGTLDFLLAGDTTMIDCDEITGKAVVIYEPKANFTGLDNFQVEYCLNNEPCELLDVNVEVLDVLPDSCACLINCVWPGDANADGRVSVSDLLPIGRYMGNSGTGRTLSVNGIWEGEGSTDWDGNQSNDRNYKHLDSDGDGLITTDDTTAISDYYAGVHNFVPTEVLGVKDYPFYFVPHSTEVDSGDLLVMDIVLGTTQVPVVDIHGLAFNVSINAGLIDSSSLELHFDEYGWFTDASPSMQMYKQLSDGYIEAAVTRTSGISTTGNGVIGSLSFIVEDHLDGLKIEDDIIPLSITIEDVFIEDADGNMTAIPGHTTTVYIDKSKDIVPPSEDKLVVFPNPVSDRLTVHLNGNAEIDDIILLNAFGQEVGTFRNVLQDHKVLDVSTLNNGIYFVQVRSGDVLMTKKLEIVR